VLRLSRQLHKAETYQTGEQGARAQVRVHGPADHVAGGFCSGQQSTELPGRRPRTLCSVIAFTASISSAHKAMLCRSANTSHWWGPISLITYSVISTPGQSVDPVATLTDCRDSFQPTSWRGKTVSSAVIPIRPEPRGQPRRPVDSATTCPQVSRGMVVRNQRTAVAQPAPRIEKSARNPQCSVWQGNRKAARSLAGHSSRHVTPEAAFSHGFG
jgi:hypothetical protein